MATASGSITLTPPTDQAQEPEPMQIDEADESKRYTVNTKISNSVNLLGLSFTDDDEWTVDSCTLDLDCRFHNYKGIARLSRLIFVAAHCPSLRIEALKLAIQHVMTTHNTELYVALCKKLKSVLGSEGTSMADPDTFKTYQGEKLLQLDPDWKEQTDKNAAVKLQELKAELKDNKEKIFENHKNLAEHFLDRGELKNAMNVYSRGSCCTITENSFVMLLAMVKVCIYMNQWNLVTAYVAEACKTKLKFAISVPLENVLITRLCCASGLVELRERRYQTAATQFLRSYLIESDIFDFLSPQDVAICGGLCALATYERADLHKYVIASSSFKLFLELDPQLREVILCFYESKYGKCLSLLEEMKDNLLLDIYLSTHVNTIYGLIRNRGLVQYFSPYLSADMRLMASCFNTTLAKLEDELMALILAGQIQARIDSHNKVLHAQDVDQRSAIFEKAIEMGSLYQRRARMLVMRSILIKHNVLVKNSSRGNQVSSVEQTPPQQPQQPVEALKTMINMLN